MERLAETKDELFNLRFQHVTGQLDNHSRLAHLRKEVARINTELRAREIAGRTRRCAEREPGEGVMADDDRPRTAQPPQGPGGPGRRPTAMDKTAVVAVTDRVRHPRYDKTVQRTTKLFVHDEANDLNVGDRVRIQETRPLSKLKRWRLIDVLERAR